MDREDLIKSIDAQIDELFGSEVAVEEDSLEKAQTSETEKIAASKPSSGGQTDNEKANTASKTADSGESPEKGKDEKEGDNGRPKDLSQKPYRQANGASTGSYDATIAEPAMKPKDETTVSKSVEISAEDYEFLQKAKAEKAAAAEAESLRKANTEQSDLIKSAVVEATADIVRKNDELQKALVETQNLVKSMANRPQARKSISSVASLEKSFVSHEDETAEPKNFTKSEMLDVAEELAKSGTPKFNMEHVIELENGGYIYNPAARALLEAELRKRG